ncbi:hypothetical protein [Gordonia sp. NPDC003950]
MFSRRLLADPIAWFLVFYFALMWVKEAVNKNVAGKKTSVKFMQIIKAVATVLTVITLALSQRAHLPAADPQNTTVAVIAAAHATTITASTTQSRRWGRDG